MLIEKASTVETAAYVDDVWKGAQDTLRQEGIEFVIYLSVDQNYKNPILFTNIPHIYGDMPPENDPFLEHCCNSYAITPVGPSFLPDYKYLSADEKAFIQKASKTGFSRGLGIPMRLAGSGRFGGFMLGTRLDQDAFDSKIIPRSEEFRLFCLLVHRRLEELADAARATHDNDFRQLLIAPQDTGLDGLSPREREVAYLIARGVSRKECARLCAISPNTVSEYLKSVYKKLDINNRVELAQTVMRHPEHVSPAAHVSMP